MEFLVNGVRIFKSNHTQSSITKLSGHLVFIVSTIHKTDEQIIRYETKYFKFNDISRWEIQISLLPLVLKKLIHSNLFSPLACVGLAKEITDKIRSRFGFLTACVSSEILIVVNIDQVVSGVSVGFNTIFDEIEGYSEVTGLAEVKVKNVESEKELDRCSICLEGYDSESGIVKAETSVCCHMFHRDCILPWLRKFSNTCPLCRAPFIGQV